MFNFKKNLVRSNVLKHSNLNNSKTSLMQK